MSDDEELKLKKYYEGNRVKVLHNDGDQLRAFKGVFIDESKHFIFVGENAEDDDPISYSKNIVDKVEPR